MINKKFDTGLLLMSFAFALALGFRVISLGSSTLSNSEASIAFSSFKVPANTAYINDSFPGIANINTLLFSVFDKTNFIARLLTAIIGACFVFLPIIYKKQLGIKTLVILGFVFALDAILIAQSRILGSAVWAILFLLLAVGSFINNHPVLSGVSAGLALLGGSSIWFAIIGLGFSLLWTVLVKKSPKNKERLEKVQKIPRDFWLKWVFALGVSLFIFGSAVFTRPTALSGISQGIIDFVKSWTANYNTTSWKQLARILIALPIYEPIILLFGIAGFILGMVRNNPFIKSVGRWFLVSAFILVITPVKGIDLLTILTIPLCVSASWAMVEIIQFPKENRKPIIVKTAFVVVLCGFIWLNATWLIKNGGNASPDFTVRLLAIIGGIVMIILVSLLIGWGWSWQVSKTGLTLGLLLVLSIYTSGMLRRAAGFGVFPGTELITNVDSYPEATLLTRTIDNLITENELDQQNISVSVIGMDSPSMVWAFRKYTNAQYLLAQDPELNPPLEITTEGVSPENADLYKGQTFTWEAHVPWDQMQIMDWLRWLTFQQASLVKQTITLWVQNTLFPER